MNVTTDEINIWLEWAGIRLASMPLGRVGPALLRAGWIKEISDDATLAYGYASATKGMKPPAPSATEIPLMDEILGLPLLCAQLPTRRVVQMRTIMNPMTGMHKMGWKKIALQLHTDDLTIKRVHTKGLIEILAQLNCDVVGRIKAGVR